MSAGPLVKRPWLLVWAAFVVLIAAWVVTFKISQRAPSRHLTPAEEADILRPRSAR